MTRKKRIYIFLIVNVLLIVLLYSIPKDGIGIDLCIHKLITGKECYNCGMTRAFLSILHLDFNSAISYNKNVVIVFPLTICIYLYSWYMYIYKRREKNEREN